MAAATEDERYRQSSQFRLWSFSPSTLQDLRAKTNLLAQQQIEPQFAREAAAAAPEFLSPAEEAQLVRFFTTELIRAAQFCELPTEIRATAAVFLRRFYVTNSVMTYPPTELLKTCLFFGCKAEGFYIRLAKLAEMFPNTTGEQILAGEFLLCQGMRFAFDVRHPFRALEGAILELRKRRSVATAAAGEGGPGGGGGGGGGGRPGVEGGGERGGGGRPGVEGGGEREGGGREEARINRAHARAREILKFSPLLTDAYFHYSPSQIMMAALLMVDAGLVEELVPGGGAGGDDAVGGEVRRKIMRTIEGCKAMLEEEPPERMQDYWGTPEIVKSMKPLRKKLQKCRDTNRADLVALQKARREQSQNALPAAKEKKAGGASAADGAVFGETLTDLRDSKRRKLEGPNDPFGPAL